MRRRKEHGGAVWKSAAGWQTALRQPRFALTDILAHSKVNTQAPPCPTITPGFA